MMTVGCGSYGRATKAHMPHACTGLTVRSTHSTSTSDSGETLGSTRISDGDTGPTLGTDGATLGGIHGLTLGIARGLMIHGLIVLGHTARGLMIRGLIQDLIQDLARHRHLEEVQSILHAQLVIQA